MRKLVADLAYDPSVQRASAHVSTLAGRSEVGVCGVTGKRLPFPLGVPATVFHAEIFAILTRVKEYIEGET
jgi:hypothetical protein